MSIYSKWCDKVSFKCTDRIQPWLIQFAMISSIRSAHMIWAHERVICTKLNKKHNGFEHYRQLFVLFFSRTCFTFSNSKHFFLLMNMGLTWIWLQQVMISAVHVPVCQKECKNLYKCALIAFNCNYCLSFSFFSSPWIIFTAFLSIEEKNLAHNPFFPLLFSFENWFQIFESMFTFSLCREDSETNFATKQYILVLW